MISGVKKLYLAGPMQNIPGYNFPAFEDAVVVIRGMGYEVISPAEKDKERDPEAYARARKSPDGIFKPSDTGGLTWAQILSKDIIIVADEVDGLAMMPGWEKSSGARLEAFTGLLRKKAFALYKPDREALQWVDSDVIRQSIKENMP